MKRFYILALPLLLASCTLPWQEDDFSSVISRHTEAQFDFIEDLEDKLGLDFRGIDGGTIKGMVDIPFTASGILFADYTARRDGRNAEINTKELRLDYADPSSSGSLLLRDLGFLFFGGEAFMKLADATGSLSDSSFSPLFSKYRNEWVALSDSALLSLSGATEEEKLVYKFSQNLSRLTMDDMREYSLKYPIWKLVKDRGVIDDMYTYDVELHKDNLKALITDLTLRLTETRMADEAKVQIDEILASINFRGTLRIDREDELYGDLTGKITTKGAPEPLSISFSHVREGVTFSFGTPGEFLAGSLLYDSKEQKMSLSLNATASGAEIGNLQTYAVLEAEKIRELSLTASAEGVQVSVIHKSNNDGTFEGKSVLPLGTMTWTGAMIDDRLSSMRMAGQALGGNLSMVLSGSGEYVSGPLRLTLDNEPIFMADISVKLRKGIFAFIVDILSPEIPDAKTRFSLEITHSRKEDQSIRLSRPDKAIPYSTIEKEMDRIAPLGPEEESVESIDPLDDTVSLGASGIIDTSGGGEEKDPR